MRDLCWEAPTNIRCSTACLASIVSTLGRALSDSPSAGGVTDAIDHQDELQAEIAGLVSRYFERLPPLPPNQCPLSVPLYGADEVCEALDVLLTREVTMGKRVREFERRFAEFVGTREAIMVNSGSSANLLALSAIANETVAGGLRPGDEVIVPAVTWSTTVAPILQLGCVPVLVDINEETLNIRADLVEEALSPRTRAIFCVHLLGNPVEMESILRLARERDLWLLEDSCEALGSTFKGRRVGSFGDFGTFSFYFSHHITTIEGGMLVTDDPTLADLARSMRAHGWTRDMAGRAAHEAASPSIDPRFLFVTTGYNVRPTEVQAAFGLVQLPRLDRFNEIRRRNARFLLDRLQGLSGALRFVTEREGARSTWFGFAMMLEDSKRKRNLSRYLERRGIETRPIVAGNLAIQPAFRDGPHRTAGTLRGATAVGERGLFIGNHPALSRPHLEHIVKTFESYFSRDRT